MNSIATAISNGRTDTSFVDDLNALLGTVNSRVALLLRSIEVHPVAAKMCCSFKRTHPSPFPFYYFSLDEPHTRVFCRWPWRAPERQRDDSMELWTAVLVWAFGLRARACMRRRARSKRQTKHIYHQSINQSINHRARDARRASPPPVVFPSFSFLHRIPAHAGVLDMDKIKKKWRRDRSTVLVRSTVSIERGV